MGEWTLFSNHGHVLVCLANNNQARLRDVAAAVGITERAVQNILRELQQSGIVQVSKHGRCNHYQINTRKSLRHSLEAHCSVGKLLALLKGGESEPDSPEIVVRKKSADQAAPPKTPIHSQVAAPASSQVGASAAEPTSQKSGQIESADKPPAKIVKPQPVPKEVVTREVVTREAVTQEMVQNIPEHVKTPVKESTQDKAEASHEEEKAVEQTAGKDDKKPAGKSVKKANKTDVPPSTQQGSLF
jgi:hypothetical protein